MKGRHTAWFLGLAAIWLAQALPGSTFKEEQLRYPRVRAAYQEKESALRALFRQRGAPWPSAAIFIRIFKWERSLEVWTPGGEGGYILLKEYPVCAVSGSLGPKREEGDLQIPEGFYYLSGFNPTSRFHLSLRVNYPNSYDRIISVRPRLGGDIFIHGACVTIGCVPIRDENIKEVYLLAVEARSAGQSLIPVHIFPARFTADGWKWLRKSYWQSQGLIGFWENLKEGYDRFEARHRPPRVTAGRRGRYLFTD